MAVHNQPNSFEYQGVNQGYNENQECSTEFIQRIESQALNSLAVKHPYLEALSSGDFADKELAFKDFAYQYGLYSSHFIQYMSALIKKVSNEEHKAILIHNLEEELGDTHGIDLPEEVLATVIDQPHTKLFQRFQNALGVDDAYKQNALHSEIGNHWAKQFLQLCETNQYVGIGAIGIGTEFIVSAIYRQILEGIIHHTNLKPHEHVFFDLHSECDDEHAEQIIKITTDLLDADPNAREQIEFGANQALQLRINFWNAMLENTQSPAMAADQAV